MYQVQPPPVWEIATVKAKVAIPIFRSIPHEILLQPGAPGKLPTLPLAYPAQRRSLH